MDGKELRANNKWQNTLCYTRNSSVPSQSVWEAEKALRAWEPGHCTQTNRPHGPHPPQIHGTASSEHPKTNTRESPRSPSGREVRTRHRGPATQPEAQGEFIHRPPSPAGPSRPGSPARPGAHRRPLAEAVGVDGALQAPEPPLQLPLVDAEGAVTAGHKAGESRGRPGPRPPRPHSPLHQAE